MSESIPPQTPQVEPISPIAAATRRGRLSLKALRNHILGLDDGGKTNETRRVWMIVIALIAAGMVGTYVLFVEPPAPDRLTIATGSELGHYYVVGGRYADFLAGKDVTLSVRQTAGSVENLALLRDPESGVEAAIIQGGVVDPAGDEGLIETIGSLYREPIWVFYRGEPSVTRLTDLAGKRIAIGSTGSGTRAIALKLLARNGFPVNAIIASDAEAGAGERAGDADGDGTAADDTTGPPTADETAEPAAEEPPEPAAGEPTTLARPAGRAIHRFTPANYSGKEAADMLIAGEVDAAFFVVAAQAEYIGELLREPGINLMSFDRHDAYDNIFKFISTVHLPAGLVDLSRDLPARDHTLLALPAMLMVRADLHPNLKALLLYAAQRVHRDGGLFDERNEFPSLKYTELPASGAIERIHNQGPPFLQRYLPFWLAAIIDRLIVMLIPLIIIAMPLMRIAPPIVRWRIRSRIWRWYGLLRDIERELSRRPESARVSGFKEQLRAVDLEVISATNVPKAYMEELYTLRLHLSHTREKLDEYLTLRRRAGQTGLRTDG
jgi:TRAP-type uncharacterized transport system substrate-binding protein